MDFPISPVVERVIDKAKLTYRLNEGFTRSFPQPFSYMTMRAKFDQYLVDQAISAGACFMDGFRVNRIEAGNGGTHIIGEKDSFIGKVLVGADGANSVVAHQLGLLRDAEIGAALESEVYTEPQYQHPWESTAGLDFGSLRGGYMWVFPKEDHLSIGVAGFIKSRDRFRTLLNEYLGFLQLGDYKEESTKGHRLPRRRQGMAIQKQGALLVGDAAGLVDFWTGEGIYYAIKSAQLAVPAIYDYFDGKAEDLEQYEASVDEQLMPELHIARTMTRIGVWFPWLAYTLMKHSDRAWNAGCQLLRNEKSYHDFRNKLGPFTFLFDMVGRGT